MENTISESEDLCRVKMRRLLPLFVLLAMASAFLIVGAVLPLYGFWFQTALLSHFGDWALFLTSALFPGWALTPSLFQPEGNQPPSLGVSWQVMPLLILALLPILLCYLQAMRLLPQYIGRKFIFCSTLALGVVCILIPVVTSADVYSYIIYARMGVIHHLNPLTTIPTDISYDPVYAYLYWHDQPSAYGPIWAFMSGGLQWLLIVAGTTEIAPMIVALRLLGLAAHFGSTLLIWSIAAHLQRHVGSSHSSLRIQATLAFAWNPLLLFEACTNAHNDAVLLLFILFALWLFVRKPFPTLRTYASVALVMALATCIKVNAAMLLPGFLLFLWVRPRCFRLIGVVLTVYIGTILVSYLPFWENGALLNLLRVNPGTYRTANTFPEVLSHLYNSITNLLGAPPAAEIGSPAEGFFRMLSLTVFVAAYGLICWRAAFTRHILRTPLQLIRWMAVVWLLYTLIGTPWFWPWYLVTFFGLFALIEAVTTEHWLGWPFLARLQFPLAVRLLAFSMLSLYIFYAWAPFATFIPGLPGFRLAYLRGLWAWLLPLLARRKKSLLVLHKQEVPLLKKEWPTEDVRENHSIPSSL